MKGKIFQNMVAVGTVVFALCVTIFMGALYEYFESRVYGELESEAKLSVQGVASGGMDFLTGLDIPDRLTWVAADGTVLYDTAADASTLENSYMRESMSSTEAVALDSLPRCMPVA